MINKLKRSLTFKISIYFLLVVLVLLFITGVYAYKEAKLQVTESYKRIADVISLYGESCISDYVNNPEQGKQEIEDFAHEMQCQCQNDIVQMIFIARQNKEISQRGDIITLVTESDLDINGENGYFYYYDFDPDEMAILEGYETDVILDYNARVGRVFSFCHGFSIKNNTTGKTEKFIVGVSFQANVLQISMGKQMLLIFAAIACLLLMLVFLIGLYIRFYVVRPFEKLTAAMNGFVHGDEMSFEPLQVKGLDERAQAMESFNTMAGDIRKYVESVREYESEKQKDIAELSIAADIQKGLLPQAEYNAAPFVIKGYMHQAKNVGGDLYYYERLDENRIAFAIGDVSGKGVSAALFMATTVSAVKYNLRQRKSPAKAIRAINNDIIKSNPNRLFVTLFVGILNTMDHTLTYSNAGHNPPYLIGDRLTVLSDGRGLLAGIFPNEEYEDVVVPFGKEDAVFLYTDGVSEAVNSDKEFFGNERMEKVLSQKSEDMIDEMIRELKKFTAGTAQYDDITMLTIRIREIEEENQ